MSKTYTRGGGSRTVPRTQPPSLGSRSRGAVPKKTTPSRSSASTGTNSRGRMFPAPGQSGFQQENSPGQRGRGLGAGPGEDNVRPDDAADRTPQRRDGYSVIPPNMAKKETIAAQAEREQENYRRHREKNKLGHVSYVGTIGGDTITEDEARKKLQQETKMQAYNSRLKSQQYRAAQRSREDEEIQKKKAEQRRKAEANEARKAESLAARHQEFKDEHRRVNEKFLQRLQSNTKPDQSPKTKSEGRSHQPEFPAPSRTRDAHETSLDDLQRAFPSASRDVLSDLLWQTNGNIEQIKQILS